MRASKRERGKPIVTKHQTNITLQKGGKASTRGGDRVRKETLKSLERSYLNNRGKNDRSKKGGGKNQKKAAWLELMWSQGKKLERASPGRGNSKQGRKDSQSQRSQEGQRIYFKPMDSMVLTKRSYTLKGHRPRKKKELGAVNSKGCGKLGN